MKLVSFINFFKENRMWITNEENEVKFCSEYILSESIKPKEIEFGSDLKNKEWTKLDNNFYVTYFTFQNHTYVVIYNDGYIGFGSVDKIDNKSISDILNLSTFKQTDAYEAIYVINYVFYVITKAIEKFKPETIKFDGFTTRLKEFYVKLLKNKHFIDIVDSYGYDTSDNTDEVGRSFITFKRK